MKIYIDYVLFLNFMFDFILLMSIKIILKRRTNIKRIIFASLVGSSTIFVLFVNISSLELFIIKFIVSIIMCLVAFSYKNIKYTIKNISYLYLVSVILGGSLYLLNIEFSYNHQGLLFYHNGLSINVLVLLIISPIIIYIYIKQTKALKYDYSYYHQVEIKYNKQILNLTGFLDTGNKLKDPVTNIPIIVIEEKQLSKIQYYSLIPYHTIGGNSLMKCIKPEQIKIDNNIIKEKVLIGLSKKINMDGIECILNSNIMEEIW